MLLLLPYENVFPNNVVKRVILVAAWYTFLFFQLNVSNQIASSHKYNKGRNITFNVPIISEAVTEF